MDYDGRLRFHVENTHGAKIYKDFIQRFAVKVEDHPSEVDLAPSTVGKFPRRLVHGTRRSDVFANRKS